MHVTAWQGDNIFPPALLSMSCASCHLESPRCGTFIPIGKAHFNNIWVLQAFMTNMQNHKFMHSGNGVHITLNLLTMYWQIFVKTRFSSPKTKRANVLIIFVCIYMQPQKAITLIQRQKRTMFPTLDIYEFTLPILSKKPFRTEGVCKYCWINLR